MENELDSILSDFLLQQQLSKEEPTEETVAKVSEVVCEAIAEGRCVR